MDNNSNASNLKRKRSQDKEEDDDVIFVKELPAKRPFFRPWLDDEPSPSEQPPRKESPLLPVTIFHRENMLSPRSKKRRDRRNKPPREVFLQQRFLQSLQQTNSNLEQQTRLNLYYVKFLQEARTSNQAPLSAYHRSQLQQVAELNLPLQQQH